MLTSSVNCARTPPADRDVEVDSHWGRQSGLGMQVVVGGIALLDAYVYTNFNAGSVPIDLRLGRQVVNWGESTFIQNGISVMIDGVRRFKDDGPRDPQ